MSGHNQDQYSKCCTGLHLLRNHHSRPDFHEAQPPQSPMWTLI